MELNTNLIQQNYSQILSEHDLKKIKHQQISSNLTEQERAEQRLRLLANEFTSILLKQMFKAMRNTVPKGELIDGGYAEEVFTDMLDGEISKLGPTDPGFSSLGKLLYEQLREQL